MPEKKKKSSQAVFVQWFGPLLDALRELGGSGKPKEVVAQIAQKHPPFTVKRNNEIRYTSI